MERCAIIKTILTGFILAVSLCGCSMPKSDSLTSDKQTYIDANLQFSISYPQSWSPFHAQISQGPFDHKAVVWEVKQEELNNDISLQVISILTTQFIPDAQPSDILFDIYPNLSLVSRKDAALEIGEAERLDGYTPHITVRAWIFRTSLRDFLLIFTAPPEHFAGQSDLFDEIVQSFEVLP